MAKVTIIGPGNMGRGIGSRLVAAGHQVQVLAPTAEHATRLAEDLSGGPGSVTGGPVDQPLFGDVVVLATQYEPALSFAADRAAELAGKVVVDITNPVDWETFDRLVTDRFLCRGGDPEPLARRCACGEGVQHDLRRHPRLRRGGRPAA